MQIADLIRKSSYSSKYFIINVKRLLRKIKLHLDNHLDKGTYPRNKS